MSYREEFKILQTKFQENPSHLNYPVISELYDFMRKMEQADKSLENDEILSSVYSLLGFHHAAFEVMFPHFDLENKRDIGRCYKLKKKAESHGDKFCLKDVRDYQNVVSDIPQIHIDDFQLLERNELHDHFEIQKDIPFLGRYSISEKMRVHLPIGSLKENFDKIMEYIHKVNERLTKDFLIEQYNERIKPYSEFEADENWYYTLELYSARFALLDSGVMLITINAGDNIDLNHSIEIEFYGDRLHRFSYC